MHTASLEEILEFEALELASPTLAAEALAPALKARGLVQVDVRGSVLRREPPPLARYLVRAWCVDELAELVVIGKGRKRRSAPAEFGVGGRTRSPSGCSVCCERSMMKRRC